MGTYLTLTHGRGGGQRRFCGICSGESPFLFIGIELTVRSSAAPDWGISLTLILTAIRRACDDGGAIVRPHADRDFTPEGLNEFLEHHGFQRFEVRELQWDADQNRLMRSLVLSAIRRANPQMRVIFIDSS